ncbi:MAG: alpha/beta hydrolase [Thermoplasmatales archaeon]
MLRKSFRSTHGTISYLEREGPIPVIFLHGLGGTGNSWMKLTQYMDESFGLYFIDLLGHGKSEKPAIEYTIPVQEDVIDEFVSYKDLKNFSLVGNSYGGWVSMRYSIDRKRPSHMILEDSAGVNKTVGEMAEERKKSFVEMVVKGNSLNSKEVIESIVRNNADPIWKIKESELKELGGKTLIIWGREDTIIPIENGRRLKELIPGSMLEEVPNAGHVPHVQFPGLVGNLLNTFLKS